MNKIRRRDFLELSVALASFVAACGAPAPKRPPRRDELAALPSLGGAPDTEQGRTVAAFVDTVVPGAHRDPLRRPGALDANAAALFFDPQLPALQLVPLLVTFLDIVANSKFDLSFVELVPSEREQVLDEALGKVPAMGFAIQLGKIAFFSSDEGGRPLGYQGPNFGYANDDDFSFRRAMARSHSKVIGSGDDVGHYE